QIGIAKRTFLCVPYLFLGCDFQVFISFAPEFQPDDILIEKKIAHPGTPSIRGNLCKTLYLTPAAGTIAFTHSICREFPLSSNLRREVFQQWNLVGFSVRSARLWRPRWPFWSPVWRWFFQPISARHGSI